MQVTVTGKQIDVGDALRAHVDERLKDLVSKYFDRALDAAVVFTREAKRRQVRADLSVHVRRGMLMQGHAETEDPYAAFDTALDRIAKQLRRYKRRLRDHHRGHSEEAAPAAQYVLAAELDDAPEPDGDGGWQPVVVAEMETTIEVLTVGEAVMRMDLASVPALMFRNRGHGGLNMVYRRPDGNVGWIDPPSRPQS